MNRFERALCLEPPQLAENIVKDWRSRQESNL